MTSAQSSADRSRGSSAGAEAAATGASPHGPPDLGRAATAVTGSRAGAASGVLVIGLGGTALIVGGWFLLHSPLFSRPLRDGDRGNVHETAAQVVAPGRTGRRIRRCST